MKLSYKIETFTTKLDLTWDLDGRCRGELAVGAQLPRGFRFDGQRCPLLRASDQGLGGVTDYSRWKYFSSRIPCEVIVGKQFVRGTLWNLGMIWRPDCQLVSEPEVVIV